MRTSLRSRQATIRLPQCHGAIGFEYYHGLKGSTGPKSCVHMPRLMVARNDGQSPGSDLNGRHMINNLSVGFLQSTRSGVAGDVAVVLDGREY